MRLYKQAILIHKGMATASGQIVHLAAVTMSHMACIFHKVLPWVMNRSSTEVSSLVTSKSWIHNSTMRKATWLSHFLFTRTGFSSYVWNWSSWSTRHKAQPSVIWQNKGFSATNKVIFFTIRSLNAVVLQKKKFPFPFSNLYLKASFSNVSHLLQPLQMWVLLRRDTKCRFLAPPRFCCA